ncbi:hypothetical protein [Streptomyces sp. NPDC055006]
MTALAHAVVALVGGAVAASGGVAEVLSDEQAMATVVGSAE